MEAASGMAGREKRSLDPGNSEEGQPDRKRPALARYFFIRFELEFARMVRGIGCSVFHDLFVCMVLN